MEEIVDGEDDCIQEFDVLPPVRLEEGIHLQDLVSGKSTEFKLQPHPGVDYDVEEDERAYFTSEQMLQHLRPECVGLCSDEEEIDEKSEDLGDTPFSVLAMKMTNVGDDGKLKKRMLREGVGNVVTVGSHVTVQYNAYKEFGEEPYDSTYLRNIPARFRLGKGACIVGMELALLTMKKGERSQFLLHPDIAYGPRGCPPRIPPDATVLFEITLEDYMDQLVADAYTNMTDLEKEENSLAKLMEVANAYHRVGTDLFKKQHYRAAAAKFQKGADLLERVCNPNGQAKEDECQNLLLRLYTNIANCSNKNMDYERTCINCRKALEIDSKNTKAHFHYGRALLHRHDFVNAEQHLKIAQRNQIQNEEINGELVKLDEKWQAAKKSETEIAARMMKHCQITTPAEQRLKNMSETERQLVQTFRIKLKRFEKSSNQRLDFPPGIGLAELNLIKEETLSSGLKYVVVPGSGRAAEHICIMKPDPKPEEVKQLSPKS